MAIGTAILAVSTAIKIGSAIADHVAQDKKAKQQRTAADKALALKSRDISIRGVEEHLAARQKRLEGSRRAQAASGRARASAAAAGVEGRSVGAQIESIQGDLGDFYQSVESNLAVSMDQLDRVRSGAIAERDRRVNAAQGPSLLNTALRVGGAGFDFLSSTVGPPGADVPSPGANLATGSMPSTSRNRSIYIDHNINPVGG